MSLTPGTRIGTYDVISLIGAGGMGEVYRARDTKLDRDVALKVLPSDVTSNPERLGRFEREAKILASLNHPNIAAIHGLEGGPSADGDGTGHALVLELVEGPTLAARIATGPLPWVDAIPIARQIAEALEAAHGQGVIHRDLKPANIKVTPAGVVKVLDFGLAKPVASDAPTADVDVTRRLADVTGTREGVILGTAPYMSPEQARGEPLDKRTDVWAFGCVLFEMLTGQSPFTAHTVPDTIVRVLDRDPDWELLPPDVPDRLKALLRRCLQKNPHHRCPDATQARRELDPPVNDPEGATPTAPIASPSPTVAASWLWWLGATVVVLGAILGAYFLAGESQEPIDSVAVLPFDNASTDPDGEYLSDGITENLINRLSTIPDLRVVPRGIAFGYQGRTADLQTASSELGVRAIVTGRVAERDGMLIVRAELTDMASVSQLWGAQYNQPMTDILSVEEDLVRQISTELRLQLSTEVEQQLTRRDTDNGEAYQLFLKSRHHNLSLTPEGLDLGLRYAQEAVELDPTYGLGYAALSDAYVARTFMGIESVEEGYSRARASAERAVEFDKVNAYPRLMMGFIRHHGEWDWEGARVEFARALELDPASGDAHQSYSEALVSLGRMDEALEHAQRAVELDPLFANFSNWLAGVHFLRGDFAVSLARAEAALELQPGHQLARLGRIGSLANLGRFDEAAAALTRFLEPQGIDPSRSPGMAELLAKAGQLDEAARILRAWTVDEVAVPNLVAFARASAAIGDLDRAFAALDRAYDAHSSGLLFFPRNPENDVFRSDPRFVEFVERMNFPE